MAMQCSSSKIVERHLLYIGLGSNQGDRHYLLRSAVLRLGEVVGVVERVSSFIETKPWGFVSSFAFLNAVVVCRTHLPPLELLERTQQIERELGRRAKSLGGIYQDRPIDIDILLYDNLVLDTDRLTIPHPLMHARSFVLQSMVELAPDLYHPKLGRTMMELLLEVKV